MWGGDFDGHRRPRADICLCSNAMSTLLRQDLIVRDGNWNFVATPDSTTPPTAPFTTPLCIFAPLLQTPARVCLRRACCPLAVSVKRGRDDGVGPPPRPFGWGRTTPPALLDGSLDLLFLLLALGSLLLRWLSCAALSSHRLSVPPSLDCRKRRLLSRCF